MTQSQQQLTPEQEQELMELLKLTQSAEQHMKNADAALDRALQKLKRRN